jgi:hypothetical protein
MGAAIAQIAASSSTILRILPPGMQPPVILQFNAANVPVIQLTMSSDSMPEKNIRLRSKFPTNQSFHYSWSFGPRALRGKNAPDQY